MYADLLTAVDFSAAQTAVLSVIGIVVGFAVAWKGGKFIYRAVKGA